MNTRELERDAIVLDARELSRTQLGHAVANALIAHAHSSEHHEHYTPAWIGTRAGVVLEGVTLDPMSSAAANTAIGAEHFWTCGQWQGVPENVFLTSWAVRDGGGMLCKSRVWLNPAGGKLNAETLAPLPKNEDNKQGGPGLSAAGVAFGKLSHEWSIGNVDCALFLAFSLNVFRTAQSVKIAKHFPHACAPTSFPFVTFRERIQYDIIDPTTGERVPGKSPPQDSAIVYLPPRNTTEQPAGHDRARAGVARFVQQFQDQGHVRT